MVSKRVPSLTAFQGPFSDLLKLFEDDNREELAKYFPIKNWRKFQYIDENDEIKTGIGHCFAWYYKNGPYIGYIDLDKKIQSLINKVINPLYKEKHISVKKEDAPRKHGHDNFYYCYDNLSAALKIIKGRKKQWGWEYDCNHPEGPEGYANEDIQDAIEEFKNNFKKIFGQNYQGTELDEANVNNLDEIIKITEIIKSRLKEIRRKEGGRPHERFNVLIYHLIKEFTYWKYDKNRELLINKDGRIELKKYWNLICFVLLLLHIKNPFKELEDFIKNHRNKTPTEAFAVLRKRLQREYSNLKRLIGEFFPSDIYVAGFKGIIATDSGFKGINL